MEKTVKKLICHNNKFEWIEDEFVNITVGKEYPVTYETDDCFFIICDDEYEESYTKEPDEDGHSYKNWFTLVEETEEVEE